MVEEAARRGNNHIAAFGEVFFLFTVSDSAVNKRHLGVHEPHVVAEGGFDLHGEFPGRLQNQAADLGFGVVELGEDGKRERCRLAGAGLCGCDEVATGENNRNGAQLDRGRFRVAHPLCSVQDGFRQAEILK